MMRFITCISLIAYLMTGNLALANCDWKTGIQREGDRFSYSKECNLKVRELVYNEKDYKEQISNYKKALELKDLAIEKANERSSVWRKEASNQYSLLQKHSKFRRYEQYVLFGGGILAGFLSVWLATRIK